MSRKNLIRAIIALVIVVGLLIICCLGAAAWFFVYGFVPFFEDLTRPTIVEDPDEFYTFRSGIDFRVIPLVQPHQLISINGETWYLSARDYGVDLVEEVGVINRSIIIVYSSRDVFLDQPLEDLWYVINLEESNDRIFRTTDELDTYLQETGHTRQSIGLEEVEVVYNRLVRDGTLDWFPD